MASKTLYSFVTKRDERKSLALLKTTPIEKNDDPKKGITLKIIKTCLTANNKFYLDFGDKPPFYFNKCYPVDDKQSSLVDDDGAVSSYVHPNVWGVAEVTSSAVDGVGVGTRYLAQLPMGEVVSFAGAKIDETDDHKLVIERPATNPAYNVFSRWSGGKAHEDLAMACGSGIVTGYGLDYHLRKADCFGADAIVITSASSKVALALALFLRHDDGSNHPGIAKKIVGYTSEGNKEFCQQTGLYDEILGYEDSLNASGPKTKYAMVDIAGRGSVYTRERAHPNVEICKLLTVGNSSSTPEKESTFSSFSITGTIKMLLTMFGLFPWLRSKLQPVEELYLIMDDMKEFTRNMGIEKTRKTLQQYEDLFCEAASAWISVRTCDTEDSIRKAFCDILEGTVPPSETIVLDVAKAVAHRK